MMRKVVFGLVVQEALAQCKTPVCDSFDTYSGKLVNGMQYGPNMLNASISLSTTSPITAAIDSSFSYSSPSSLRINCTNANSTSALLNDVPTTPWPVVYGRAMLHYSNASGSDVPIGVHSWIFNAAGTNSFYATTNVPNTSAPNGAVSMNLIVKDQVCFNYHWATGEMSTCSAPSPTRKIVANQWHCIQWHYDGPNHAAEIFVNGTRWVSVVGNTTNGSYAPGNISQWRFANSPGWKTLQFGFTHYQTLNKSVELHLDDYVLDTVPTCCPCSRGETYASCCAFSPAPTTPAPSSAPSASSSPTVSAAPTNMGTANGALSPSSLMPGVAVAVMSLFFFF